MPSTQIHYITGLRLGLDTSSGSTTISVTDGVCRDADDQVDIIVPATVDLVDPSVSGLGGLDTGTLTASTAYGVYVLRSRKGTVAGLMSALPSTNPSGHVPDLPSGWGNAHYRRVGTVFTNPAADGLVPFTQTGADRTRSYTWTSGMASRQILDDGSHGGPGFVSVPRLPTQPISPTADTSAILIVPSGGAAAMRSAGSAPTDPPELVTSTPIVYSFTAVDEGEFLEYQTSSGTVDMFLMGFSEVL